MADIQRTPTGAPLKASQYFSPYTRAGAPGVTASAENPDSYAASRGKALETLEAMGFDPLTMAECGVVWGDHQDPYNHVQHAQYPHYFAVLWQRNMESYAEFMDEQDYENMITGKSIKTVVKKYEIRFKRQVGHPDCLIAAYRQLNVEPTGNSGNSVLFSLQQQAIVAETYANISYIDAKTGRPADITKSTEGWRRFYYGFQERVRISSERRTKWEAARPPKKQAKI